MGWEGWEGDLHRFLQHPHRPRVREALKAIPDVVDLRLGRCLEGQEFVEGLGGWGTSVRGANLVVEGGGCVPAELARR